MSTTTTSICRPRLGGGRGQGDPKDQLELGPDGDDDYLKLALTGLFRSVMF